MAIRVKDDSKITYHVTLEGQTARVMAAMILMSKANAQFVVTNMVNDEYGRSKSLINTFMAQNAEKIDAAMKHSPAKAKDKGDVKEKSSKKSATSAPRDGKADEPKAVAASV